MSGAKIRLKLWFLPAIGLVDIMIVTYFIFHEKYWDEDLRTKLRETKGISGDLGMEKSKGQGKYNSKWLGIDSFMRNQEKDEFSNQV